MAETTCTSCTAASAKYTALHDDLFEPCVRDEWLSDGFRDALQKGEHALRSLLTEEVPKRVYSFEMLTPSFCKLLLDELDNYERSGLPVTRPNSMNNYGLILNQIGMKPMLDEMQRKCLLPLSKMLFPAEGSAFDSHHSFMVKYRQDEDLGLDMHHDDSDVTLNVCLGKEFEGATLSFCGYFGQDDHRKHVHTYSHRVGRAVMHLGTHRHGADNIISGERYSLIMWSTGPYRQTEAYKRIAERNLHGEDKDEPDAICLSYTHDPDYGEYKAYPKGKSVKPASRRLHISRFTPGEAANKAMQLKVKGGDDVKAEEWSLAACKYKCAADYATSAASKVPPELLSALMLNEAHCRIKLGEDQAAVDLCTEALAREPSNVKALYRRAVASISLHEYGAALSDLLAAAKLEPSNKAVRAKIAECAAAAKREKENEKVLYTAMLGGGGNTIPHVAKKAGEITPSTQQ
uniref:Fe2OG dioxygenase domain-containing protein n=1 Tax=Chrysotila carterae TaxID=13221 RepID=A0A7S4FD79_CHRCT